MIICRSNEELRSIIDAWKTEKRKIGFVPTMGALHEGHLSLVKIAQEHSDRVVVSIFVNPTQFAPHEDFDAYPRTVDTDLKRLKAQGAKCVFLPKEADIYPKGRDITVHAGEAADGLESDFRPHFFDGVCTVVHRFFKLVRPDVAVFGEKDYQQLMVIREMVETYEMPIEIIGGPIARDEFGLALSSRNAYLNAKELEIARKLNQILSSRANTAPHLTSPHRGEGYEGLTQAKPALYPQLGGGGVKGKLLDSGFTKVDYIEERWGRILAAAWIGKTRLIDNLPI